MDSKINCIKYEGSHRDEKRDLIISAEVRFHPDMWMRHEYGYPEKGFREILIGEGSLKFSEADSFESAKIKLFLIKRGPHQPWCLGATIDVISFSAAFAHGIHRDRSVLLTNEDLPDVRAFLDYAIKKYNKDSADKAKVAIPVYPEKEDPAITYAEEPEMTIHFYKDGRFEIIKSGEAK